MRNWKSPLYWQRITAKVRKLADERIDLSSWGGIYVPRYRSLRQIAGILNGESLRTRQGKEFSPETVRLLLARTATQAKPERLPAWAQEFNETHIRQMESAGHGDFLAFGLKARVNGPKRWYRFKKFSDLKTPQDWLDLYASLHESVRGTETGRTLFIAVTLKSM